MHSFSLTRRIAAEALGTAFLAIAVIGSGIMADARTNDDAVALLANSVATGAALVALISVFGPVSGAHFNPAVSLVFALSRDLRPGAFAFYAASQIAGAIAGTVAAHAMFALPLVQVATTERAGWPLLFAEGLATFGLVTVIIAGVRLSRPTLPLLVGLYIAAAYWFAASTSFANPAMAIARAMTDTFAGIRPADVAPFVAAECAGALGGLAFCAWLLSPRGSAA